MASATAEEGRAIEVLQEALESLKQTREENAETNRPSMRVELRSLEFWRAIIAECLGSFLYVFLVCGAIGQQTNNVVLSNISAALASGLGAMAIIHCFGGVSGKFIITRFSQKRTNKTKRKQIFGGHAKFTIF